MCQIYYDDDDACCSSQLTVFIKIHLIFISSITAKENAHFPHDLGF